MSKEKLQGVKLIKIKFDTDIQYLNYRGWHYRGEATYKIGLRRYKCEFMINKDYCDFTENINNKIPKTELQRQALLVLIYGEISKYLGKLKIINYFKKNTWQKN